MFLIDSAWAQDGGGGIVGLFLPLILIFGVFYLLLIRPQQRRQKEHQAKLTAIQRGDKIVTAGGIFGVVTQATKDHELQVEIADGVRVKVNRQMVADVINPKAGPPPRQSSGGLMSLLFGGGKSQPTAETSVQADSDDGKGKAKGRGRPKKSHAKKGVGRKPKADKASE